MLTYRLLTLSALLICPTVGLAQNVQDEDKCTVQQEPRDDSKEPGADKSLTDFLDECHGVIKPPAVGDEEMRQPAPKEGKTPIIKPGQLPQDS